MRAMTADDKVSTGIPALDEILKGGLARYSVNVLAGPPGTGKTILAQQIVFHNAQEDRQVPYLVTVSEPTVKMLRYSRNLTFFDVERVGENVIYLDIGSVLLEHGLNEVARQIEEYTETYAPNILAIDSFKAIHEIAEDTPRLREFAYRLAVRLTAWGTTTLLVGEYTREAIHREPIFAIADGIVLLDQENRGMQTYRYLEVLKMRGDDYDAGKHPFRITSQGLNIFPRVKTPDHPISYSLGDRRVSLGVGGMDDMTEGGVLSETSTLVAGSAGTGKTLLCLHFLLEGIRHGDPGLLVTFQETPSMLKAFAKGFGWDLENLEQQGLLSILYSSPVELGVDEHTQIIRDAISRTGVKRIAMDSLKDIELATPDKVRYKDYVYSLVNSFRQNGITSMLTSEIPEIFGSFVVSEYGISFVADNVVLLRYVEMGGRISRAMSVLKMRGSNHSKEVREYQIESQGGVKILEQFADYDAVLSGSAQPAQIPGAGMLPPRTRNVLGIISARPGLTQEQLAAAAKETPERIHESLEILVQLGYVVRLVKNEQTVYKATMG
jgi:circadian clock protein KaiC